MIKLDPLVKAIAHRAGFWSVRSMNVGDSLLQRCFDSRSSAHRDDLHDLGKVCNAAQRELAARYARAGRKCAFALAQFCKDFPVSSTGQNQDPVNSMAGATSDEGAAGN